MPAPRRNLIAINDCNIAKWLRHRRHAQTRLQMPIAPLRVGSGTATPTGWAVFTPPAGCQGHPGKTIKRSGERIRSLNRSFFVFIAPVGIYRFVPQVSRGNSLFIHTATSRIGSRADGPGVGVQGARSPLLCSGSACTQVTRLSSSTTDSTRSTQKPGPSIRMNRAFRQADQYLRLRAASAFFLRFTLGFS